MKTAFTVLAAVIGVSAAAGQTIVSTDAYEWRGDSVIQREFVAYAPSPTEIVSNYSGQPHFFMPVDKKWTLKNDISAYPQLHTSNRLHQATYNMALDEMVNAVEPDTTLRTGKEWAGVWTRDVSYSIILSMAYMQPEAAMISLRKKVTPDGRIVQDTGSGGAWPVSTDRMVWALAAYEVYKVTGDKSWLEYIYPIIKRSLADDSATVMSDNGLVRGETSFIDWREQSYPRWMQTADIYRSEALGTSVVHAAAYGVLARIAADLGHKKEAARAQAAADKLAEAINREFWMDDKGYYGMCTYGRNYPILNPRAETLGESLAILYDIASKDRARSITANNPTTPYGAAIFFPQIKDMPAYHNNALWPFVASYWALANAKAGNEQGTLEAIGSVIRPAALFATNKENFNLDNGDIATELNSSNMLWSLSGNLALTYRILFGIHFEENGLRFAPFIPKALAGERTLSNFPYRNARLNITVIGYGDKIKQFLLNGREHAPFLPAGLKGENNITITMADNEILPIGMNHSQNVKAPLTPVARLTNSSEFNVDGGPVNNLLEWAPIEYINHYQVLRNGKVIGETRCTWWPAQERGEYQVIGVDDNGVQSFASEPLDNFDAISVEMPDEATEMKSSEISYMPSEPVAGFHGQGFAELEHKTTPISLLVDVPAAGRYALTAVYANGNGPVNTENKCAIRSITVNGSRAGVFVMPTRGRGNWNDWGRSNSIAVNLRKGINTVVIRMDPTDENMNMSTNHALVDRLLVTRLVD